MIAQYFIMRNGSIHIEFVSAINKLKSFLSSDSISLDDSSNEIISHLLQHQIYLIIKGKN